MLSVSRNAFLLSIALVLIVMLLILLLPVRAAHADGGAPNLAYVAGASPGVSVIDIQQQQVTNKFSVAGDAHMIYLSLDGRFLYVTQPALGRVAMLAAKTGQTICTASVPGQPTLLAFDAGANLLYAAGNGAASISGINATTCAIEKTIATDGPVYGLALATVGTGVNGSTGNQLWVAAGNALAAFNSTGQRIASIALPGAQYVTIPAGSTVYVDTRQGSLVAVDLGTHQVVSTLLRGGSFGPMDYDAITGEIYVPDAQNNQVDVLAPIVPGASIPHEPSRIIRLDASPQSVAITNDGQFGFVALKGGSVAMLDIPGKQIVKTINVGGDPHFIIVGLYPPLVGTTPQQASIWTTVINIVAYALVIAFLLVPMVILWRVNKKKQQADTSPPA
ncbi:MAG: YncE family protein [Ktedonobacteraceae bacterium]|nr:YncE family protein [Ktedonobacteraceae bacterium]